MQFELNNKASPPKLIAVIGCGETGIFYRTIDNGSVWINESGVVGQSIHKSLETLLREDTTRQPIYEGDVLTITF